MLVLSETTAQKLEIVLETALENANDLLSDAKQSSDTYAPAMIWAYQQEIREIEDLQQSLVIEQNRRESK